MLALGLAAALGAGRVAFPSTPKVPVVRVELHLARDARLRPHLMLMTLGGPIYCMQLFTLARNLDASLLCTDYGRNGYEKPNQRSSRLEDWGDPAYLAAVGRQRARLARDGIKISKLVVVGVSYSGYADAELVATHPELRPDALVVVDSYLDLAARFRALPRYHPTRREMMKALGGTPDQKPAVYAARSPSHHLDGLARAIRSGMKLVVVWTSDPRNGRSSAARHAQRRRTRSGSPGLRRSWAGR